jgi:uncharacterized membrane protein
MSVAFGIAVSGADVYISGYDNVDIYVSTPCYWLNGVQYTLPITGTGSSYNATGIAISGTDVYISGYNNDDGGYTVCYWKNGTQYTLSSTEASMSVASDIAVSGADVYISGYDNVDVYVSTPCYWLNGVQYTLPMTGTGDHTAMGITVSGTDVYILGYDYHNGTRYFWLNGELIPFPSITGIDKSIVVGLALVDNSTD